MTYDEIHKMLTDRRPPCLDLFDSRILEFDARRSELAMQFQVTEQFCHSGNIVQGGFVTAMLDATMAHAVMFAAGGFVAVPTLDLHVSFLRASHPGEHICKGRVLRQGSSVGFLEAELFNGSGETTARATSTVTVRR